MLFLWLSTLLPLALGQGNGRYALPDLESIREARKPAVPEDLARYFDLNGQSRQIVNLFGLRPGIIPPKNFDIGGAGTPNDPTDAIVQSILGQALAGGNGGAAANNLWTQALQGAEATSDFENLPQVQVSALPSSSSSEKKARPRSSTSGIPNVFPTLPKAPIPQPQIAPSLPSLPNFASSPDVPSGGLGPLRPPTPPQTANAINSDAGSLNNAFSSLLQNGLGSNRGQGTFGSGFPAPNFPSQFQSGSGVPIVPSGAGGSGGPLISSLMNLFGLNSGAPGASTPQFDLSSLNSLFGIAPPQSGNGAGLLSSVLYNSLSEPLAQATPANNSSANATNSTDPEGIVPNFKSNIALLQQLITQPSSPFCNPKPQPVAQFDVDAFMGTWYQTLYSPPMSAGPCSMVGYKKIADVGNGGPGTVFDTFEYTTEGTPFGRPRISSGYAIVRGTGELIYRTTSSPTDVNVNVLETGPVNAAGEYEYVVIAVNCNYPIHVFARDPVVYKQKYEAVVNTILEQRGLTNGFSRLLNVVAPVDASLCTFPPTLFNIQG